MKKCRKCSEIVSAQDVFCLKCGAPLSQQDKKLSAKGGKRSSKLILTITSCLVIGAIVFGGFLGAKAMRRKQAAEQCELGQAFLTDGDYLQAIQSFEKALDYEPKNIEARLGLADAYHATDRVEDAIKILQKAMDFNSKNPELCLALAVIYYNQGQLAEALHVLEEAPPNDAILKLKGKLTAVSGVSLAVTELTLDRDANETLAVTIVPLTAQNKNITWSSSAPEIATVSSEGIVTGIAAGTATITATTDDGGKTATCLVTVRKPALTYAEAKSEQGIYIKRGEGYYALQPSAYGAWTYSSLTNACMTDSTTEDIPTYTAGDELVVFSDINYSAFEVYKVNNVGYTIPVSVGLYESAVYPFRFYQTKYLPVPDFPRYSMGNLEIETINGQSAAEFDRIVTLRGEYSRENLIDATENEEFTFGYYSGTSYYEFTAVAFAKYYVYDHDNSLEFYAQNTKSGYSIIQIPTTLEKGLYVIKYGFNWYAKLLLKIE